MAFTTRTTPWPLHSANGTSLHHPANNEGMGIIDSPKKNKTPEQTIEDAKNTAIAAATYEMFAELTGTRIRLENYSRGAAATHLPTINGSSKELA